ncbi:hypothetical protein DMN91_000104 [Ooceraea biroi]|uniref:Sodium channel protein Nach n=1 Tax=Ooceraea biroi TaxID=2015173 RepID=A0A3L8E0R8_OOCBI|nr:hypothetical protein DMN91_000104 [Ooceraea biroi]
MSKRMFYLTRGYEYQDSAAGRSLDMKQVKIQTRKKPRATWWDILKKETFDFCRETGLHGYKYISQTQRSKPERIVWAIIVLTSFCCALALINMSWDDYASRPTLTVIESTHHGIWHYPFPAITICNFNRVSYNLTKEFVNKLKIPTNISKEYLIQEMRLTIELILPGVFGYDVQKNLTRLQNIIDDNDLSILDVISSITRNCSTLLIMCKWKGLVVSCDKHFKQSLAREGFCCSFNYYTSSDAVTSDNVQKSAACGSETGMSVIINPEPNDYHATYVGTTGVKTMVHYSYDYPNFNAQSQIIRLNSEHFLSINPALMYSKEEVRDLAISTRNCIFDDEANGVLYADDETRNLTFAKYTYHNCLAECRASIVKAKCGCIPYYFPQNSTRVCNFKDVKCLKKYESYFDSSWPDMEQNYRDLIKLQTPNDIEKYPCGCMPDCTLYVYPIESSFGTLDSNVYYNKGNFLRDSR